MNKLFDSKLLKPLSFQSTLFSLSLNIEFDKFNIPLAHVCNLFFEPVNLDHELSKDLSPLFVFVEVFLLFVKVFLHELFIL